MISLSGNWPDHSPADPKLFRLEMHWEKARLAVWVLVCAYMCECMCICAGEVGVEGGGISQLKEASRWKTDVRCKYLNVCHLYLYIYWQQRHGENGSVSRTLHNTFFLVSVRGIFSLQLRNRSMQSVRLFQNFKSDINMYSFTCFDRKISELVSWEITTF